MIDIEREVRDEGNCVRATGGGEEACDRVRKRRVCCSPPGRDHVKAALAMNRNVTQGRTGTFPVRESAETTGSIVRLRGAASIEKPTLRKSSD